MSANDGDLVDRMANKHSVSPAAVQVVLAALRSGGGRMAQFSHADFGGMSQWSPACRWSARYSTRNSRPSWTHLQRHRGPSGHFGKRGRRGSERQLSFTDPDGELVAVRIGEAGRGRCAERYPICGFSQAPAAGDRRSGHRLGI